MMPILEICWQVVQRVTVEGIQKLGLYPGLTTAQGQYIDTFSQFGGSQMSVNVNSFQGTTENASVLVLGGRLATPLSFLSPEFLLSTCTSLTGVL